MVPERMEARGKLSLRITSLGLLTMAVLTLTTHACLLTTDGCLFKYGEDQNNPHILLEINFEIVVIALRGNEMIENITIYSHDVSTYAGAYNETDARLNIIFPNGIEWVNEFKVSNEKVDFDRELQFVPSDVFRNSDLINDTQTHFLYKGGNKPLSKSAMSYLCESKSGPFNYDQDKVTSGNDIKYTAEVTDFYLHAQAFNVENGKFSPAERCSQDCSVTTPKPSRPDKKYTMINDNNVCISLESLITITIDYSTTSDEGNLSVQIPGDAESSGNCNLSLSSQMLVIHFFKNWSLTLVFSINDTNQQGLVEDAGNKAYSINEVALDYVTDGSGFPSTTCPPGSMVHVSNSNDPNFVNTLTDTDYFYCASEITVKLNDNVRVSFTDLKFKAFNRDDNANFTGSVDKCSAAKDPEGFLPIVLGCTIPGALLLTILFVVMVRRRKGKKTKWVEATTDPGKSEKKPIIAQE